MVVWFGTMTSADFLDYRNTQPSLRPPRVRCTSFTLIPAACTYCLSGQVLGFEDDCLLSQSIRLVCDSCSSGQCFASGFLQPTPHDVHLAARLCPSPYRADSGLSPVRRAPCLAHNKKSPSPEGRGHPKNRFKNTLENGSCESHTIQSPYHFLIRE